MAETTKAVTGVDKKAPVKKIPYTINDDDTYSIDDSLFESDTGYFHGSKSPTYKVTNKKGKEEEKKYAYRYEGKDGKYHYIDDIEQAPAGAEVRTPLGNAWMLVGNSKGKKYNDLYNPKKEEWLEKQKQAAQAEIDKRVADRKLAEETKAKEEYAKKLVDAENAKNTEEKDKSQKEYAEAYFPGYSFDQYNTDITFDNSYSSAKELIEKAQAEGMTYEEFLDAIKNTKWNESKQLDEELEAHKDGWDNKGNKGAEEKSEEQDENPEPPEPTKEKNAFEKYISNILYGNDIGSTEDKEAKEQKESKNKEFWKNNPSIAAAIFSKDSGYNMAQRAAMLGAILANGAGNALSAYSAGLAGRAYDYKDSNLESYFKKAQQNALARKESIFESENKADIDKAEILSRIDNTSYLSLFSKSQKAELATLMGGAKLDRDEFIKRFDLQGEDGIKQDKIYSEYVNTHDMWQTVLENQGKALSNKQTEVDIAGKELENISRYLATEKDCQNYINDLLTAKRELEQEKVNIKDVSQERYFDYIDRFLGYVTGVQNANKGREAGNVKGWDIHGSVGAGYGPFKAEIGGGYKDQSTSRNYSSEQIDLLRKANIPVAEDGARKFSVDRDTAVKALLDAIQVQIDEIDVAIASAKSRQAAISGKAKSKIDDGIVKAPHMKQWLVREDGTKIQLHPNDSIYATKKTITTEKDNGEDVVPMEKEDKALVIQKKLGYSGNYINKNFDDYLSKLK